MNRVFFIFLLCLCCLQAEAKNQNSYRGALTSLLFVTENKVESCDTVFEEGASKTDFVPPIEVTSKEIDSLWKKLLNPKFCSEKIKLGHLLYKQAEEDFAAGDFLSAHSLYKDCAHILRTLWQEKKSLKNSLSYKKVNGKKKELKALKPYLISQRHPLKPTLDAIFSANRVTQDKKSLEAAGFIILHSRPRSYVKVVAHPLLSGYLLKVYLDNELRQKRKKPYWKWLSLRCEGAAGIRTVIKRKKIKYFVVPQKWIYLLPDFPLPPNSPEYQPKKALLVVEDMRLTSNEVNLAAWKTLITPKHLDELYTIISSASGSSYRPDNIAYTVEGNFAFIDTEYPHQSPDFKSIRPFLSEEMRKYWDKKIKKGG